MNEELKLIHASISEKENAYPILNMDKRRGIVGLIVPEDSSAPYEEYKSMLGQLLLSRQDLGKLFFLDTREKTPEEIKNLSSWLKSRGFKLLIATKRGVFGRIKLFMFKIRMSLP